MNLRNPDLKELACFIYETLKTNGIQAALVGGACVSIYSENRYQSSDLDFATYEELKPIEKALSKLGFKRTGRQFFHPECPYLIDFVNPPISVGHEAIREFDTLKTATGSLRLLSPTDCVKDRLAAFFHWNDAQGLEQALMVAGQELDTENLQLTVEALGPAIQSVQRILEPLFEQMQMGKQSGVPLSTSDFAVVLNKILKSTQTMSHEQLRAFIILQFIGAEEMRKDNAEIVQVLRKENAQLEAQLKLSGFSAGKK